ncbi:MAG: DUF4147 domain-containing protein [Candidatus Wallbacteria bacterium]|nr:DUF4147 domain-containing protein [Candidatus Wallbacteria bacterium]
MDFIGLKQLIGNLIRNLQGKLKPQIFMSEILKRKGNTLLLPGLNLILQDYHRIGVTGAGKAAACMSEMLIELVPEIESGIVNTSRELTIGKKIRCCKCSHPYPDEATLKHTQEQLETYSSHDLIFFLLSGGASSMLEMPLAGISLADLAETGRLMLQSGLGIEEINTVRKHLSRVKGGRFCGFFQKSTLIGLYLSDVVSGQADLIGSGPTFPDPTTYEKTMEILKHHRLWAITPASVRKIISEGIAGKIQDTPKTISGNIRNFVVADNLSAVRALQEEFGKAGLQSTESTNLQLDAECAAEFLVEKCWSLQKGSIHLAGGEIRTMVRGAGFGGRIQELALRILPKLPEDGFFAGIATDGVDGNTPEPVAAALVTSELLKNTSIHEIEECLSRSDSYNLLNRLGALYCFGPSGTNLADIYIVGKWH